MRCYSIVILATFISIANTIFIFDACVREKYGNRLNISYPSWIWLDFLPGYQGFGIACNAKKPILTIGGENYNIKDISYFNHSFIFVIFAQYECSYNPPHHNFSLVHTSFHLVFTKKNLVFHYN